VFYPDEHIFSSEDEIQNRFKEYCDWCWGHGFGNCDKCREYKDQWISAFNAFSKLGFSITDTNKLTRDSFIIS
jgi:hypothetical protein